VPFPGSLCVDEAAKQKQQSASSPLGDSRAECDQQKRVVRGSADAAVLALPAASSPLISVAHASSSVETVGTAEGTVTTVTAIASGIRIGGIFTIGRVYAEATTKAHGRTGTTVARFKRLISDVHGPGIDCAASCDPRAVVEGFNRAFASQARIRAVDPFSLASPHGYQGLVVKDPGLKASDMVILNDDSNTFNALDIIINNDGINPSTSGPNARSRLVVGLAGVHAESRYGIFPILRGRSLTQVPGPPPVLGSLPEGTGRIPQSQTLSVGQQTAPGPAGPAQVVRGVWKFVVNHPGEAALLFVLLLAFGSPVYLALRSRTLARALRT
jgi:hypothetical protein